MLITRAASLFLMAAVLAVGQGLTITTSSPLLPAASGVAYSQSLAAAGGTPPYAWSVTSGALPPGLTLSAAGALTGTPEAAGTYQFTLRVMDGTSATATKTVALTVITAGTLTRFGVLSHIAAGGWWDTSITLINTTSVPIAISVVFRADDGSTLSLPLKLTQQGLTQTSTAGSMNAMLNPNSTVVIATGAMANTVIGWADVQSSGPVSGYAIMRSTPTIDRPASEATVPLTTSLPSSLTLPYDNADGYVMGVALVNLVNGSANISATVWDENGTQVGVQQIPIGGNGHTAFVLPDRFPQTAGRRGIVQFQSAFGGVSGLGLRFSPSGLFTDVPVIVQQ